MRMILWWVYLRISPACVRKSVIPRRRVIKMPWTRSSAFAVWEAIPYAYINRNRLLCYQSWLLDKGRSLNTVSTYMRRIRHIYNLAVEANEAPFVPNLFKDVFTGVESKRKKRCRERCWIVYLTPHWRIRPCGVYSWPFGWCSRSAG